jgi:hypothetical protein
MAANHKPLFFKDVFCSVAINTNIKLAPLGSILSYLQIITQVEIQS